MASPDNPTNLASCLAAGPGSLYILVAAEKNLQYTPVVLPDVADMCPENKLAVIDSVVVVEGTSQTANFVVATASTVSRIAKLSVGQHGRYALQLLVRSGDRPCRSDLVALYHRHGPGKHVL